MARLSEELKSRVEAYCDRVIKVARSLDSDRTLRQVVDQLMGCGTSVGANVFEADEAMSRPDFVKCLCIAVKELNESIFGLRLVSLNEWVRADRITSLLDESLELKRIFGSMIGKSVRRRVPSA